MTKAKNHYNAPLLHNELRKWLFYEPATGHFIRLKSRTAEKLGSIAGWASPGGYRRVSVVGSSYLAHRLAWFYMTGGWPAHQIDHINGKKDDNRWVNLREATNAQNNQNVKRKKNTGLHKGVRLMPAGKGRLKNDRWVARIRVNGREIHLGCFVQPEDAIAAYRRAAIKHHGEYAAF